ncbi:MAG: hypothetical protein KGD59_03490 [Candidatus Heimdallarchaeota archaeon]|nr:hypothetical protein [Candidatus Heimdallarchaeota archaeon]MBY8993588.1 hypothetical protein [Candidatus Heimdallarchaeota archaeon]
MQRLFVISLTELNYEKKDLNVPFSEKRQTIGYLARIITNAIFLSHSLREKVTIRVYIEKPISHIIQIDSATIKYLGPELRSLASLILKAKKKFQEALTNNYFTNNTWLEANPGFFVRLATNPFQDLSIQVDSPNPLVYLISDINNKTSDAESYTLKGFEKLILNLSEKRSTFIIYLPLVTEQISKIPIDSQDFIIRKIAMSEKIDYARLTNIVNIILDKSS